MAIEKKTLSGKKLVTKKSTMKTAAQPAAKLTTAGSSPFKPHA